MSAFIFIIEMMGVINLDLLIEIGRTWCVDILLMGLQAVNVTMYAPKHVMTRQVKKMVLNGSLPMRLVLVIVNKIN